MSDDKVKYMCYICDEKFSNGRLFTAHIKNVHKLKSIEYYRQYLMKPNEGKCLQCGGKTNFKNMASGFFDYCSRSCAQQHKMDNRVEHTAECAVCGETFTASSVHFTNARLSTHASKVHGLNKKEYYDKYLKKPEEGICENCGKETPLDNWSVGYKKYCSLPCAVEHREKTHQDKLLVQEEIKAEREAIRLRKEREEEEWQEEITRRLAEFEGDKSTMIGQINTNESFKIFDGTNIITGAKGFFYK